MRGDRGRFMTVLPSLKARGRLGEQAASELGAPVVCSRNVNIRGIEPRSHGRASCRGSVQALRKRFVAFNHNAALRLSRGEGSENGSMTAGPSWGIKIRKMEA